MALRGCARVLLVIINLFFVLIGAALLGGGIFLKVATKQTASIVDKIKQNIPGLASGAGIGDADSTASPMLSNDDIDKLLNGVAIAFISLGLFLFLLGLSGCFGACCAIRTMLVIYLVFVVLVFIGFLSALIIFATKKIDESIKSTASTSLQTTYQGIDDFNIMSLLLNYFMITQKCCGLNGYKDFHTAAKWKRTRTMDIGGKRVTLTMETPVACCKMNGNFPSSTPQDRNCTLTPTDVNNNWKTGCDAKITLSLDEYRMPTVGACAGIMLFQLLCFIMAVYIIKNGEVAPEKA